MNAFSGYHQSRRGTLIYSQQFEQVTLGRRGLLSQLAPLLEFRGIAHVSLFQASGKGKPFSVLCSTNCLQMTSTLRSICSLSHSRLFSLLCFEKIPSPAFILLTYYCCCRHVWGHQQMCLVLTSRDRPNSETVSK